MNKNKYIEKLDKNNDGQISKKEMEKFFDVFKNIKRIEEREHFINLLENNLDESIIKGVEEKIIKGEMPKTSEETVLFQIYSVIKGYKTSNGKSLKIDGYFGPASKKAFYKLRKELIQESEVKNDNFEQNTKNLKKNDSKKDNIGSGRIDRLPVNLTVFGSYEKSNNPVPNGSIYFRNNINTNIRNSEYIYGLNFINLSNVRFEGFYMNEIENLITNSKGTVESLIKLIKEKNYKEEDLFKLMAALSAEAYIRIYDNNLYKNRNYDYAKKVLSQEPDGDLMIKNLKEAIETGKHIDTLTCIQYSTVIAQILKKLGYDTVETGTIDIGVQHRFTVVKGKNGLTYIISDGQIYSGKDYKEAYINYQASQKSITFRSDMFDSNNKYIGSYQTDTMKYLGNIVSANGSLNTQNLAKRISKSGINEKSSVEIDIGNTIKKLGIVSINENGYGYNLGVSKKYFLDEGTTVTAFQGGLKQTFNIGENSRIKLAEQLSLATTKFANGNEVNTYGVSFEATSFNGFNQDPNGKVINNGFYGNIATAIGINIGGIRDNIGYRVPVSNVELTSAIAGKVGYKNDDLNTYLMAAISGQLQNMSSTANTGDGKPIMDGYSIGGGIDYTTSYGIIGTYIDYDRYRGNYKTEVGGYLKNEKWNIGLDYSKTSHESKVVNNGKTIEAFVKYNITKNIDIEGSGERKYDGNSTHDSVKIGFNVKF